MKGVKCILSQKLLIILALLFIPLFALFISNKVSAINLGTTEFTLRYSNNNGPITTHNQIYYGRQYGQSIKFGVADTYSFYTTSVTTEGNFAVIHFETNLVISTDDIQYVFGYWTNLFNLDIQNVYVNGTSYSSNIISRSLSTAVTEWTTSINGTTYYNSTLTVYGDVVVGNLSSGVNTVFQVVVGNTSFPFYTNTSDNPDLFYFEQNPMTIEFTSDINNALLQTQINQNNTIINQNQQIIDQDNQDRQDLQNASNDGQEAAEQAGQAIDNASASLLTIIGNFVNIIISPPASDCTIDADMGHMDLGTIDLCQLSPPPAFGTIATILVIGFTIPFAYSLIMTFLSMLKGATQD